MKKLSAVTPGELLREAFLAPMAKKLAQIKPMKMNHEYLSQSHDKSAGHRI